MRKIYLSIYLSHSPLFKRNGHENDEDCQSTCIDASPHGRDRLQHPPQSLPRPPTVLARCATPTDLALAGTNFPGPTTNQNGHKYLGEYKYPYTTPRHAFHNTYTERIRQRSGVIWHETLSSDTITKCSTSLRRRRSR